MFKMFVTVDKHHRFQSFISQATSIRLKHSSSNAENFFVSDFKIVGSFFKLGYDVFSCVMALGSSARHLCIV